MTTRVAQQLGWRGVHSARRIGALAGFALALLAVLVFGEAGGSRNLLLAVLGLISMVSLALWRQSTTTAQADAEARERFRLASEAMRGGVYEVSAPDMNVTFISEGIMTILGFEPEDWRSSHDWWIERMHPHERDDCLARADQLIAAGVTSFGFEYRVRHRDGHWVWVADRVRVVRDARGKVERVVGFVAEIDDRKRIEEQLRESEVRLQLAMDGAGMVTVDADLTTGQAIWSSNYCRLFGYAPSENRQTDLEVWRSRLHPDDAEQVNQQVERSKRERGASYRNEYRILRADDGAVVWLSVFGRYFYDANHVAVRFVGVLFDDSERHSLAQLLDRQANLLDQTHDSVLAWEQGGGLIYWNEAAQRLYGYSRDEALGRGAAELLRSTFPDGNRHEDALRVHGVWEGEVLDITRNGQHIWVEARMRVFVANDGKRYVLETSRDITERKRAELALREQEQRTRLALEAGRVIAFEWDRRTDEEVRSANSAGILGWPRDATRDTGSAYLERVRPQDRERFIATLRSLSPLNNYYRIVYGYQRPRGNGYTFLEESARAEFDAQGRMIRVRGLAADVTQRVEAEQELQLWKTIFEDSAVGIAVLRESGVQITAVNSAFARMHGGSEDAFVGLGLEELRAADAQHDLANLLGADALDHLVLESRHRRKDGSEFPVLIDVSAISGPDGVRLRVAYVQDISERKRAQTQLMEARDRLQMLSTRLMEVQEAERRQIARELHDEIGPALTVIKLRLRAMQQQLGSPVQDHSQACIEVTDVALAQLRSLSASLRPAQLDSAGLAPAINSYVNNYIRPTGLAVQVEVDTLPKLDADLGTTCFRVVQEALTNVMRHADATQVLVRLAAAGDEVHLWVRDNGRGFDVAAARERASRGDSFGLLSMQERVSLSGGALAITSDARSGTTVQARLSLRAANHSRAASAGVEVTEVSA